MANDREMLRTIWKSQVALRIRADPEEIVGIQQPEDFYLIVSRLSYFLLVTDKVIIMFTIYYIIIHLIILFFVIFIVG